MTVDERPTKRQRREERRAAERTRQEVGARRRGRRLVRAGAAVAVIGLVALGVVLAVGQFGRPTGTETAAARGQQFANLGQQHVAAGAPHAAYNSNPPTSGPHDPSPARWGVYDQPVRDETLVHNLEHGGVVVHYNCPDGCPELVQQLKDLVGQYRSKVILAPRPNRDVPHRITLSAWTWLDGFDDFDAERIRAFIAAHKDRGPELLPD